MGDGSWSAHRCATGGRQAAPGLRAESSSTAAQAVVTLIWLLAAIVVAVVVVAVWLDCARSQKSVTRYETMVELHAVRRRFDVAQVKSELRRDAATARRELRDELDGLHKRGRP